MHKWINMNWSFFSIEVHNICSVFLCFQTQNACLVQADGHLYHTVATVLSVKSCWKECRRQVDGGGLFSLVGNNRTRGSGHNLEHSKFSLNIRTFIFFLLWGWWRNRLLTEVMEPPSLEIFKTCLDFPVQPAIGSLL